MRTADFDYELPPEYIAQTPVEPRDASRLMVLERSTGQITHTHFREIGRCLRPHDVLVLNQTRVIPARIFARKVPGGGKVELLLLRRIDLLTWEALVGGKGLVQGRQLQVEAVSDQPLTAQVAQVLEGSRREIRFERPVEPYLPKAGQMPLPPYIHTPLADPERYQTVYSRQPGSAAAPTAGLHFTSELLEALYEQGVGFATLTLHVGLDTFAPVHEQDPGEHAIHSEWCQVTPAAAEAVNLGRQAGGRIVAVGTTSVRTLESSSQSGVVTPFEGPTSLFILPGYRFRCVDAMVTNFHLPRSTLIMLVSAFAGRELVLHAYETAKREGYRFYSFGDAMLIL